MKSFFRLFTHNWGLKLLALALALITYLSIKDSLRTRGASNVFLKGSVTDGQAPIPRP